MAETLSMMELAKVLGEWRPVRVSTPPDSVTEQIRQYVELFRVASPKERTEARKIFRAKAVQPNWTAFEFWMPKNKDYFEALRLRLASIAACYGTTYTDGSHRFDTFEEEVKKKGRDWQEFAAEYSLLAADYIPVEIDLSDIPEISEEAFTSEINRLTAAIKASPDTAELYSQRGMVYLQKRAYEPAIRDLSKAARSRGADAEWGYQLGRAYAALGFVAYARGAYMSVVMGNPNHPRADEMRDKINEWRYLTA